MTTLFIISLLFILYTYLGYPLLLLLRRPKKRGGEAPLPEAYFPSLSLLIPVYNEEKVIGKKLENALRLDYPRKKLEIVVVSDGSRDGTNQIVEGYRSRGVKFINNAEHRGKMKVINQVVPVLTGEMVVFTDASALFAKEALKCLARRLADPAVGAVSGELVLKEEATASGPIRVDWYWRLEKFIRRLEGEISSTCGATGAIYALRRRLFRKLPEDTILDDLMIPLQVIEQGFRVVFESRARAYEEKCTDLALEFRRKVRTLAGNFQVFARSFSSLLPGHAEIAFNLVSHKLFRLFIPFALLLLLASSVAGPGFLQLVFFLQIIFYLLAGIGLISARSGRKPPKLFSLPLTFCLLNAAAFWAFVVYFFRKSPPVWK